LIGVGIVYWAGVGLVFLVVLLVVILVDQGLAQARTWVLVFGRGLAIADGSPWHMNTLL
jgi:hypothetical protein